MRASFGPGVRKPFVRVVCAGETLAGVASGGVGGGVLAMTQPMMTDPARRDRDENLDY